MDTDRTSESLSPGGRGIDVVAAVVDVAKRVLLYCSPSVGIIILFPRFGDAYYRTLAIALAVLVVALSAWSLVARPPGDDLFETVLTAWFYNMAVFGASVFAVLYAASPLQYVFLIGFPLAAVEFSRHLGDSS
jgi:hypothetical protein